MNSEQQAIWHNHAFMRQIIYSDCWPKYLHTLAVGIELMDHNTTLHPPSHLLSPSHQRRTAHELTLTGWLSYLTVRCQGLREKAMSPPSSSYPSVIRLRPPKSQTTPQSFSEALSGTGQAD